MALSRAIVAGGTGAVGEGIVRMLAAAGVAVFVPARSRERLDGLLARLPAASRERVSGQVVAMDDVDAIAGFGREVARAHGPVDAVVASLGGWAQGEALLGVAEPVFRRALDDGLGAHFRVMRALAPQLVDHPSSYTFVNGFSARAPYPQAGPVSVSAAGQLMLAQVLAAELADAPLRVNALVLGPVMTRARTHGRPEWLRADDVGRFIVEVARSTARGEVFSLLNRAELDAARARLGAA
ncbi:MAG: SDR family oxidoreductase [Anaeromyxobacter sp.]